MDLYKSVQEGAPAGTSLAVAATAASFFITISAVPTVYSIYKKKDTNSVPVAPYFMMFWSMSSYVAFGILTLDLPCLISQTFGTIASICYIVVYVNYASRESQRLLLVLSLLSLAHLASLSYLTYDDNLFGLTIMTGASNMLFYFSPLFKLVTVCRTKSVKEMPLPLTLGICASAVLWFLYSFLVAGLQVVWILSLFGICFGTIQLLCYCLFYKSSSEDAEEKEAKAEEIV